MRDEREVKMRSQAEIEEALTVEMAAEITASIERLRLAFEEIGEACDRASDFDVILHADGSVPLARPAALPLRGAH